MLQHRAKDPFVAAVLADLPETPPYFSQMKRVNREGPPVLDLDRGVTAPPSVTPQQAAGLIRDGAILLDLRGSDSFAAGHVPRAINIGFGSRVGFWAGWVVPPAARLVLMTDDERQAIETRRQLLRVGLDDLEGIVAGGFEAWQADGLPTASFELISAQDLQGRQTRGNAVTVVDVRSVREWQSGHLPGAINVPVGDLPRRAAEIPRHAPVATICEGGFRSSLAASLLERAGVPSIVNVAGGMTAYRGLELTR
jgi:hydroxyacylglutathione hydrolase